MVSLNLGPIISPSEEFSEKEGSDLVWAIVEWFFQNFEDPVENTPYESAEGGYQYIWGGPHDAREEIENYFSELPEAVIDDAVREIERQGDEWAPNSNRIFDEDPPDDPYRDVQSALDNLQASLAQVRPVAAGIGGNNPPEHIGLPPYTDEDHRSVLQAIEVLRTPERVLASEPGKAEAAAKVLKGTGQKIMDFLKEQGKRAADAFSTEAGKRAAQLLTGVGVWECFGDRLIKVYAAVTDWLGTLITSGLHPPF
jgi:hypothetical protein